MKTPLDQVIFNLIFEDDKKLKLSSVDILLKQLSVDTIFVASIDKQNASFSITNIMSNTEYKEYVRTFSHSMDVIRFLESSFDEKHQYASNSFDMIYELCHYYTKRYGQVLITGMYRDELAFDGIVAFIDFNNLNREWSETDRSIATKLACAYKDIVATRNLEASYTNSLEQIKNKYEGRMEVFDTATNEYKSIFVIDYDTELVQLFYGKGDILGVKANPGSIGSYSVFLKKIKESFDSSNKVALNDLSINNVKARIKSQDNYFVSLTKDILGIDTTIVFKFSLMVIEGRKTIVLSIRTVTFEIDLRLRRANELETILNYNRQFDTLTAIYNRNTFIKEATNTLDLGNGEYFIITFDFDRFAVYNSYYGIPAGDDLLRYAASQLNSLERTYKITYGKLYNDNFVIMLDGNKNTLIEFSKILRSKMKSFDNRFTLRISIGVYQIVNNETPLNAAMDYSMEAKKKNKDRVDELYCLFDESMAENRENEQEVINAMDGAIENKEFTIYLQPKVDVNTSKLIGAEALVRWFKNGKMIPPNKFVPIFEKNGFIKQMDMYVWEETLKYLRWRIDNNLELFPISVNVSRVFMNIPTFVDDVTNLCVKYGVETKYLELEITESIFMDDIKLIKQTFDALRSRGFKILMDDFGSGYSSLNVLKDIEFDILKVDLKFFSNNDERSLKIIQTVIDLSKALNIPAIAEGVETIEYVNILKKFGCDYAQGYYYSKPIDVEAFNEYVKNTGVSK